MSRPVECECTYNFTCGYCCRNAKPWLWTPTPARFLVGEPECTNFSGEYSPEETIQGKNEALDHAYNQRESL